jgi:hypothetical protein
MLNSLAICSLPRSIDRDPMKPLSLPSNQHALLDARDRGVEALLTVYPASTSLPPVQGARATASPETARLISRLVLAVNDLSHTGSPAL